MNNRRLILSAFAAAAMAFCASAQSSTEALAKAQSVVENVHHTVAPDIIVNPLLDSLFHNEALVLVANTVLSTGVILITGEFLPKTTFRINPNLMMRGIAIPIYLIYLILYPIKTCKRYVGFNFKRIASRRYSNLFFLAVK